MDLSTSLRARREAAGLSQAALATAVGITRQSLLAAERGRQVPSTVVALRLARALGCRVEDLFHLGPPDSLRAWVDGPTLAGRVALGNVDGRWVAHAIGNDTTAVADGMLDAPVASGLGSVVPFGDPTALDSNVLVAGCAPPLGPLGHRAARPGALAMRWLPHGSGRALDCLVHATVHVAGVHLHDARSGRDNLPFVRRRFSTERMLVVNLVGWRQGIVVAQGNPRKIREVADLLRPRLRVAQREAGTGAHKLLRRRLTDAGAPGDTPLAGPRVNGHVAVANAVALGAADAGIAIESVAIAHGLGFVPLVEECFDLVVPVARAEHGPVARLLAAIDDPGFRRELEALGGYAVDSTGHASTLEPSDAP
jgi:putative molybdopterin biosynthesis protein